jgi:isoleucyl-tRNA synthetase
VLDCWFESGSMPFAQAHYPFENRDQVEQHTADFIVEYIAQTRGWFYTMHVLSVALFDRAAFQNCICHGVVLDEDSRKLSKRLRNYPDPVEVFETIGSDALRWFLMASPILRGGDLRIDREGTGIQDAVRLVLNPIWNTWHFFALYANVEGYEARWRTGSTQLLDRYILAKTRELVEKVQASFDAYEIAEACGHVTTYLDALTNWYVRRSRDRFWGQTQAGDVVDPGTNGAGTNATGANGRGAAPHDVTGTVDAFDTLYTVLHVVSRVTAPLLPYLCEEVYQGLTGERSVHLTDWPDATALPADHELVAVMDKVREVCSAALSLREANGLRVRLPLARLTVAGRAAEQVRPFVALIADELNVKTVELTEDVTSVASFVLRPNTKVLGPKLGADVQKVVKAAREGAWSAEGDGTVSVAGQVLQPGEFELALTARGDARATVALRGNDTVVDLDVEVTDELRAEGTARDLVRLVQQARKDADLHVADRIRLVLQLTDDLRAAIGRHEVSLAEAVLATEVVHAEEPQAVSGRLDGQPVSFSISRR